MPPLLFLLLSKDWKRTSECLTSCQFLGMVSARVIVRPVNPLWKWQGQKDSNPRPSVLETDALPTELYPYGPSTDRLLGHFGLGKQGLMANSPPQYDIRPVRLMHRAHMKRRMRALWEDKAPFLSGLSQVVRSFAVGRQVEPVGYSFIFSPHADDCPDNDRDDKGDHCDVCRREDDRP